MINAHKIDRTQTIFGFFYSWKNDLITEHLKTFSAHTRNELAMIKSLIKHGDNIIDIGAHIGTFSIPLARFNGGSGKVFSFEANPGNYALLNRNITENGLDGIIIPAHALVSMHSQKFSMALPADGNSGMYYYLPDSTMPVIEADVINIDSWHTNLVSEVDIKFIKIDVEGAEVLVLRSCQQLIQKYTPIMYIETSVSQLARFNSSIDDIDEILKPCGYHYFRNVGERNSNNDTYKIAKLENINSGGQFFDLLAIHKSDPRYPGSDVIGLEAC